MRASAGAIISGIVVMVLGNVFNLQGQSVIGPESSFMYSNPEWTGYGAVIVVVGGVVFGAGIALRMIKR